MGVAAHYAFHLTCCDVLYFVNRRELEPAIEDVAFVAPLQRVIMLAVGERVAKSPDEISWCTVVHYGVS